jgi:hypothetical protein
MIYHNPMIHVWSLGIGAGGIFLALIIGEIVWRREKRRWKG